MSKTVDELLDLPDEEVAALLATMSAEELAAFSNDWETWARDNQKAPPGNWQVWLNLGGRGAGKTRTGAEWVHQKAMELPGSRGCLLGATGSDVRETMIEGVSGILSTMKAENPCVYEAGRQRVVWKNGTIGKAFTAEKPNRLRGPQHHWAWPDEIAAWQYPQEAWDMMMLGLRLGMMPQACVTTTPKPIKLIIDLFAEATEGKLLRDPMASVELLTRKLPTVIDVSSSFENRANLSESWYDRTIKAYEGTSLYDQEVLARILTDVQGALWKMALIEATRIRLDPVTLEMPKLVDFDRVVVAVDPAVTSSKHSNETGIMACARGVNAHGYLLADYSGRWSPLEWATRAVRAYHYHKADRIVAEKNQGGEMVKTTIHTVDPNVPVKLVDATRGKIVRAEPIAAKYEQHKIHHVGTFGALEAQMTTWTPDSGLESPDRFDALVWGFTELLLGKQGAFVI